MTDMNSYHPAPSTNAGASQVLLDLPSPQHLSSASSYRDLQYLFGQQDPAMLPQKPENTAKSNNRRRKTNQDSSKTKHRRTRSGCYTCRSRRVKCDENHPVCERCRKGGRDCVYPEAKEPTNASSKKATLGSNRPGQSEVHGSPGSSSEEEDEDEVEVDRLEAIPDEDETLGDADQARSMSTTETYRTGSKTLISQRSFTRHSSETPSLVQDKGSSPTPSTEGSIGYSAYQGAGSSRFRKQNTPSSTGSQSLRSDWSHLPPDLQYYLAYFTDNLTHYHYSLKYDPCDFLRTLFLDAALRSEALLYAVVGFSAFQATLHNPNGKIQDFLQYYNKAVSLLLRSLKRGERHNTGTILAMLQLATIEEYLGDWINLLGHQKAALEILTELYTPQTVMENDMTRIILGWYMRFDVFAGLMGGFETVLSREWFSYAQEFFQQQINREPGNLVWKIEETIARLRLIAMDLSILFAKMGKGEISREQFMQDNEIMGRRIASWRSDLDPAIQDSRYLVRDFSGARALDADDIVDPYVPGTIYNGPLWVINLQILDWYSIDLMHKYQTALTMQIQPSAELGLKAYASCQLFEAIEFFPESPKGTILAAQASLGIACLFLPRDSTHAMWARRKLATIESNGYIYPYTFRTKMSDLFQDRSCMHWWLPNDEGYPSIIRSIRKFVQERTSPAKDVSTEDLRDMKAIFSSLKLDDSTPSLQSTLDKGKGPATEVAVADHDMVGRAIGEGDTYGLGFNDGQGYWGQGQGGGAFGIPKHENYE